MAECATPPGSFGAGQPGGVQLRTPGRCRECLIRMRVREVLANVAHIDLPGMTGVVVVVHPGGDQALPGYLEMRAHENGAVRAYVPGNREYPQLPEPG